jgi:hypothetical protein
MKAVRDGADDGCADQGAECDADDFPSDARTIIYTTKAIESLNSTLRC